MKNKKNNIPLPNKIVSRQISRTQISSISGPIPPADEMEKYHHINVDLPLRIMTMAEKEASQRQEQQKHITEANIKLENRKFDERKNGQIIGLILAILALICAVLLVYLGSQTVAGIIGGTTILGLVSTFVIGRKSIREDTK